MQKYKIESTGIPYNNVTFHPDIVDILFKHKAEVCRRLIDVRGNFLIDHISIKIVDPNNEMVIFSIAPSVEYNLIVQGFWKYDQSFSMKFQENNFFYPWQKAYCKDYFDEIKHTKETKHGFTFGFNISKKLDGFNLIYSYATRSKNDELLDYYRAHIKELVRIGDYGYKLIHSIYLNYCSVTFKAPIIDATLNYHTKSKPFLCLIVNNKKEKDL